MKRINPVLAYYLLSASIVLANAIIFTTLTIYYFTVAGLNPLQLVLVGTVLEATILLLEVPTGVVADTYSRRLSIVLGMLVLGVAYGIEGSFPFFAGIIAAEIVRGLGETFLSGALDAWLADEIGATSVGPVYIRAGQIGRAIEILAIGAGVALAAVSLRLPLFVGGAIYFGMGLVLALLMPERGFVRPAPGTAQADRNPLRAMSATLRAGTAVVRGSSTLLLLLLLGAFTGVASEGWDRLWEAHLLSGFGFPGSWQPVIWFGIIAVCGNLLSLAATAVLQRRLNAISGAPQATARALLVLCGVSVSLTIAFALAGSFWAALAALLLRGLASALAWPLYNAWLVQHIDGRVRATALSMLGLTNALGQTVGGPGVGAIGLRSLRGALVCAGVLLAPSMLLYARVLRGERAAAVPAEAR